jgi:predicted TIM-barrel fold metal-dependent hydrolase
MVTVEKKTLVVDFDTHFWMPIDLWSHLIEPKYRDVVVDFMSPKDTGTKMTEIAKKVLPFQQIKGGDDPVERIKWMDEEGVHANLIYGAGLVTYLEDEAAVSAGCRAVNTWMAQFADHNRDRLKPCMILPFRYPKAALKEFRYAREELGLESVFGVPTPPEQHRWSSAVLDPVWEALQDTNTLMTFHEFSRAPVSNTIARKSYGDSYPMMYLSGHCVEAQMCVMDLIMGGVLDRFPRLNFSFVEAHCAWLPGWLALMDSLLPKTESFFTEQTGTGGLSMSPSDFFRRQCLIVAFPDDVWIEECVKYIGEDSVATCSDYPHPQTRYQIVDTFRKHQSWATEPVIRKILGANAARPMGIALP